MYKKSRNGSISIETSIVFSILIVFLSFIINYLNFYHTDIILQKSLRTVCNEYSYITPLSVISADAMYVIENTLDDSFDDGDLDEINNRINSVGFFTQETLKKYFFDYFLVNAFESRIIELYIDYNGSDFNCPDSIRVSFDYDIRDNVIFVNMSYSLSTITGEISHNITDVIPFYGDYDYFMEEIDSDIQVSYDEFWTLGNFAKGDWLRNHFNANLPSTFPVINSYNNGIATSYTSIDLNASTYQNFSKIDDRIINEINDLSEFDGADVIINGFSYNISSDEISGRELVVIIPANCSDEARLHVYSYVQIASESNVDLQIIEMGQS